MLEKAIKLMNSENITHNSLHIMTSAMQHTVWLSDPAYRCPSTYSV